MGIKDPWQANWHTNNRAAKRILERAKRKESEVRRLKRRLTSTSIRRESAWRAGDEQRVKQLETEERAIFNQIVALIQER